MTSTHEQMLQIQIARLEAELDRSQKARDSEFEDFLRDWEVQFRIWENEALRGNADYSASFFRKAALEIGEVRKARNEALAVTG